jgi:hypothetical protein
MFSDWSPPKSADIIRRPALKCSQSMQNITQKRIPLSIPMLDILTVLRLLENYFTKPSIVKFIPRTSHLPKKGAGI